MPRNLEGKLVTDSNNSRIPNRYRPFESGEYLVNPDGSYTTEITTAGTDDRGVTTVIPTVYTNNQGKPVQLEGKGLWEAAGASGKNYPQFSSIEASNKFTRDRENNNHKLEFHQWRPLWEHDKGLAESYMQKRIPPYLLK